MRNETIERMRIAGEYQKKAIRALFPERMNGHLDVIEKEIKEMLLETAADWMKKRNRDGQPEHAPAAREHVPTQESAGKAKKIDIL